MLNIETTLVSLAQGKASTMSPSAISTLRQVGFSEEEIFSLVVPKDSYRAHETNHEPLTVEETTRLRQLAKVVAHTTKVFGSSNKALYWLRQPMVRFDRRSPLQAIEDTSTGAEQIAECLVQISEGYFA